MIQTDYFYALKVNADIPAFPIFEVVSFDLTENLSEPFRLELDISSFNSKVDFAEIVDKPATLSFYTDKDRETPVRFVNGIVTSLLQRESGYRRTRWTMVVEPSLVRADLQSDCRVFQQKNAQEIIEIILKKNNIQGSEFATAQEKYKTREYCLQYRETDLKFIERLAAEEGTYYYFEHLKDKHLIKFSNHTGLSLNVGEVEYNSKPSGNRPNPAFHQLHYQKKIATTNQVMRDYTFTNPDYIQEHNDFARNQFEADQYEKYDYPGRYKRDAQGKPFTKFRLEYERRESEMAVAKGDEPKISLGNRISTKGHRRKEFDREWFVIGVSQQGVQNTSQQEENTEAGNSYENIVKLIPAENQWRPTPQHKPVVDGPQIAHIVGPKNEEIYCDEFGRVKIQFPWDRLGKNNELSSCWVRVSQAWAGARFGNIAIPRIGHEVIVSFLEGDPDQPIITGRTFHANTLPIYDLPLHKTRMSIQSKTHKGDGFNELRFEDATNAEEVYIHAEKDQNNVVKNNETTTVGVNRTENIGVDEEVTIGNDQTYTIGNDDKLTVGHDQKLTIIRNQENEIQKDKITKIGNHRVDKTFANHTIKTGGNHEQTTNGKHSLKAGTSIKTITKTHTLSGSDKAIIKGPAGTIILDDKGITLKGAVRVKGSFSVTGGSPDAVDQINLPVNTGEDLCLSCIFDASDMED